MTRNIETLKKLNENLIRYEEFLIDNPESIFYLGLVKNTREYISEIKLRISKPILTIDMDGVLCDYINSFKQAKEKNPEQPYPQSEDGFFLSLTPIENAIQSYKKLEEHFDVWILTRPSVENVLCYTEKALWVRKYLGFDAQKKIIMCIDKSMVKGDYLIDDTDEHGQLDFDGEFIKFGSDRFPNWNTILDYLIISLDK